MPFSRMDHLQPCGSPRGKQLSIWVNSAAQLRHIVSKHLAESPRFKKVSLHVNDQEGTVAGFEFERVRFGVNTQDPIDLHGQEMLRKSALKLSEIGQHGACQAHYLNGSEAGFQSVNQPYYVYAVKIGRVSIARRESFSWEGRSPRRPIFLVLIGPNGLSDRTPSLMKNSSLRESQTLLN